MKSIEQFSEAYAELESAIRELIAQLFSGTCGLCTACCCRVDICEEATQGAFLSLLLKKQGLSAADLDDRLGWLDLHGCTLEYGRPPVCYTFFCDELLARLPDDETRFATRVLGRLMEYVGENAVEGRHLAEIRKADELQRIDITTVTERLDEAQAAFDVIEQFIDSGRLEPADIEILAAIPLEES